MITTVCMNPSFDKTASVRALQPGELNRLHDVRVDVGGKGVNVAVVLKRLGVPVGCVGCLGERGRESFLQMIRQEEVPFDYGEIAAFIPSKTPEKPEEKPIQEQPEMTDIPAAEPEPAKASGLPKALTDLMEQNFVTEDEIRSVVAQKGYYPFDMAVEDYDKAFIDGVLVAAWPQVLAMIEENRKDEIPF